ncbi:MAG: ATP-binding protein, partial [Planctomycetes bacterium]|nr:ATP-binding protein [Planctomycetota bacterium]
LIGEHIRFEKSLDPRLGRVKVDPGQLGQVIMNFAINARDAMPKGGVLTLRTADLDLNAEAAASWPDAAPGPWVLLEVRDTGCGIPEENKPRVFEPFFTTKRPGEGTGLGLSTAYGIVRQSGGSIAFESEAGKGTAFRVLLPRLPRSTEAVPLPPRERGAVRGFERVLVAEDEELVRSLVVTVLREAGYDVLEAASGEEAERLARSASPPVRLLLTDVVMPGASGRETADRLRKEVPGLKVLFMSGYTGEAATLQGILEDGASLLQKPFRPGELLEQVRGALES